MGAATASLDASMRRAVALVAVGWQLVVIWTVMVVEPTQPRGLLISAHVALGLVILLMARSRAYLGIATVSVYAVGYYDFSSSPTLDSALFLAACWTWNTMNLVVMLLGRRRIAAAIPILVSLACGLALEFWSPIGSGVLLSSLVVTAAAIAGAGFVAVPHLWALAEDADDAAERTQEEMQAAAHAESLSREAADDARVLHDTVINTLGAIAIGGAAVSDEQLVRDRCRHDLAAVGPLMGSPTAAVPSSLSRLGAGAGDQYGGITIRRTGLDDHSLLALEAELPEPLVRALNAVARELVRNSVKHAGVDEITVDVVRTPAAVVLTVIDEGRGFDGVVVPGRGFDQSVVARMAEVGGRVRVDSEPGRGTRVVVTCPLTQTVASVEDMAAALPDPGMTAARIRARACWLWSITLVLVGLVIEAVNRPGILSPTYAMLGISAACSGLAWTVMRRRAVAPRWLLFMLVACLPPAFLFGMAGADFGRGDVFHYQAWGITPLLIMLLTLGGRSRAFLCGQILSATTALIAAAIVAQDSTAAAASVVVGIAPAVGLAFAWSAFHRMIGVILRRADADRRAALRLRLETTAREAADTARARWRVAELNTSLRLLEELANGDLSPVDAGVRERCGSEETYLRQLTLLSPDAFRMTVPLVQALALAHGRSVDLVVRTGSVDTPDAATTATLGDAVLDAVGAVDAGGSLTVGLFHGQDGPQLTLVGPTPVLGERLPNWALGGEKWSVRHQVLGDQEMVEVSWRPEEAGNDLDIRGRNGGNGRVAAGLGASARA